MLPGSFPLPVSTLPSPRPTAGGQTPRGCSLDTPVIGAYGEGAGAGYVPPTLPFAVRSRAAGQREAVVAVPRRREAARHRSAQAAAPTPPTHQLFLPPRASEAAGREERRGGDSLLRRAPLPGQSWAWGQAAAAPWGRRCGGEGGWRRPQRSRSSSPTGSSWKGESSSRHTAELSGSVVEGGRDAGPPQESACARCPCGSQREEGETRELATF